MSTSTETTKSVLLAGERLERRLEELLHQDRFPPPARFLAAERVNEASLQGAGWARYGVVLG
jgi:hypothetical protein